MDPLPLFAYPGQRNGSWVYHGGDGFFYHKVNIRANRRFVYLRCVHYDNVQNQCFGSAKALFERRILYPLQPHSHEMNVWHPLALQLRSAVMHRVTNGDQTAFASIIQQEGQTFPWQVRALVPLGTMEGRLNQIRSSLRPNVPRSLGVLGACLLLPQYEYLTKCLHVNESMFAGMCGNMPDQTLSLVFITREMQAFMQTRRTVFADGTERKKFKCPKMSQIFSVNAVWRFHVIPMLRAIMLRRTTVAYICLFQFLRQLMPNFKPKTIKCDFEEAQFNAWRVVWPRVVVEGCLWHFAVAVYNKARKLGLHALIQEEPVVASIIRAAGALPLLPTEEIKDALEALGWEAFQAGWMTELRPFFLYMETEWVPLIHILSVMDSVHRTNNASESANRSFNREIHVTRPSCFHVIRAFVVCNDRATMDLRSLASNINPGRRRKVSALRNDLKIRNLTIDYSNSDIDCLEFLHSASRRLQNVFNKVFR